MTKLDFIRGVLRGSVGQIDLSEYVSEGEFFIYMEKEHVHRYWSSAAEEDVDLDDPGMYMDAEDDEDMIFEFLQKELIKVYQLNKRKPKRKPRSEARRAYDREWYHKHRDYYIRRYHSEEYKAKRRKKYKEQKGK